MKFLVLDEPTGRRSPFRRWISQLMLRGGDVETMKLDGFHSRRRPMRRSGFEIEYVHAPMGRLVEELDRARVDRAILVPSWQRPAEPLLEALSNLPASQGRPRLALFDAADQTSLSFAGAIPSIDVYVKSQLLRDRSAYRAAYLGGFIVSDWVHHHLGFDLKDWGCYSSLPEADESKLMCGWNMGVARHYSHLTRLMRWTSPQWNRRPIEVNRRFSVPDPARLPKWEWYQEYRRYCGLRVAAMEGDFRLSGNEPLPRSAYRREMGLSRVVFSPFGWGEVCFRDFEAIACGAVLVKPDMSHLETHPDVYEDKVTYMATRWDLADLPEVCRWVLDHPDEARLIVSNARRRLADYLAGGGFDADVKAIIGRLAP